jgi:hypothetical protein
MDNWIEPFEQDSPTRPGSSVARCRRYRDRAEESQ